MKYCRQASYGIAHLLHTFISGRTIQWNSVFVW